MKAVDSHPDEQLLAGHMNFRQQVGMCELVVTVGEEVVRLGVEVFPSKVDYKTDYVAMKADIANIARALVFEYLRATSTGTGLSGQFGNTPLEWLTILRQSIAGIETAVAFVDAHPQKHLLADRSWVSVERVRGHDDGVRDAIRTGKGQGGWVRLQGGVQVRERIRAGRPTVSTNTAEHRWIRARLERARGRLSGIGRELDAERDAVALRGASTDRVEQERREVNDALASLDRSLGAGVLREAEGTVRPEFTSMTLMNGQGYREVYTRLLAIERCMDITDGELQHSTKDLDQLYELWCLFMLVRSLVEITGHPATYDQVFALTSGGLRVTARKGKTPVFEITRPERRLALYYGRVFAGDTGEQRPDIVLELTYRGWPEIFIVFDAKYRIDNSDRYLAGFKIPGPPLDAVNALHRYRDAIVLNSMTLGRARPVVKGVALFPGNSNDEDWISTRLYSAIETLGIGALPCLPRHVTLLRAWLTTLLVCTPEALAVPGPPFLAFSSIDSLRAVGGAAQAGV